MVTDVRQRVAREQLGRRGTTADPAWVHRRMLLAAGDRLSPRQLSRLERVLAADDPTNEIGAAWGVKELLRQLLAARDPADIRARLWAFYSACATAGMPETTRLATTIETWWPHVLVFLQLGVTNARTEGFILWSSGRGVVDVANGRLERCRRHVLCTVSSTSPMSPLAGSRRWAARVDRPGLGGAG